MAWLGILARGIFSRLALLFGFLANAWLVMAASNAFMWMVRAAVIVAVVLWLPLPDWLSSLPGLLSSMPAGVVWALSVCKFKEGLAIIMGAYALRMVIRLGLRVLGS